MGEKNILVAEAGFGKLFMGLNKESGDLLVFQLKEEYSMEIGSNINDITAFSEEMIDFSIGLPQMEIGDIWHVEWQLRGIIENQTTYILLPHGVLITFQDNIESKRIISKKLMDWLFFSTEKESLEKLGQN